MRRALFLFRRDLRLDDNTALLAALDENDEVSTCFIRDPRQGAEQNPHFTPNGFRFMLESLAELAAELETRGGRLSLFSGEPENILERLLSERTGSFTAVYLNTDYTPFSRKRDDALAKICAERGVPLKTYEDALLHAPGSVLTKEAKPYTVYTSFARNARKRPVMKPRLFSKTDGAKLSGRRLQGETALLDSRQADNSHQTFPGGRKAALEILKGIKGYWSYDVTRNNPWKEGTTKLSPHHKFGTISIRETHHAVQNALGEDHALIDELLWRDFFTHVAHHYPKVFAGAFKERYNKLKWDNPHGAGGKKLKAWKEGLTGYPIVDAGMRQLAATGWMHNRVRMITASFLAKDLHLDWRLGEEHFANLLVDYDPAVNNGNWQWAASTGCDAQPYFRIFNPWNQQAKFDPRCDYIKTWVPELHGLTATAIHRLATTRPAGLSYPEPIVDHKEATAEAIRRFKELR